MENFSKNKVIPTQELLSELEELEILGGSSAEDVHVHVNSVVGCNVTNTGNCVAQCACTTPPTKNTNIENP